MYKFVCDLETTGLDPIRNDIVTICILVLNEKDQLIDKFLSNLRPPIINDITWEEGAANVHGFSIEDVLKFKPRRQVLINLLHFLKPYKNDNNKPMPFICHANPDKFFDKRRGQMSWPHFDYHFLEWAFRKEELQTSFWKVFRADKIVSTITMARKFTGVRFGHKLDVWAKNIEFELDHHNAESDTLCCYELYKYFKERISGCSESTKKERLL